MAAMFEALDDFLDDYLELPIRGKDGELRTYRIASPPAEDGLRVERITTLAARLLAGGSAPSTEVLDDQEELDLYRLCLGARYDELAAEVDWARFKLAALTAMYWITADRETAHAYWSSGGDPKAVRPPMANRADRRQQRHGSSGSGAANTTLSPGSTSGTRADSRRSGKAGRTRR